MKPFNLEQAKAGLPLVTRGGRNVLEIVFLNAEVAFPILALIEHDKDSKTFTNGGGYSPAGEGVNDLFMAPVCSIDGKSYYWGDVVCINRQNAHINSDNWRTIREMEKSKNRLLRPAKTKRFSRMYLIDGETEARSVTWEGEELRQPMPTDFVWIGPVQEFYA